MLFVCFCLFSVGYLKGLMAKDEKLQHVLLQDKGMQAGEQQKSFINWKLIKLLG